MQFLLNNTDFGGSIQLTGGAASIAAPALAAGSYDITAVYTSDSSAFSGSTSNSNPPVVQVVNPAPLTVTGSGTQVYGGGPAYVASYAGFVLGQTASVLGSAGLRHHDQQQQRGHLCRRGHAQRADLRQLRHHVRGGHAHGQGGDAHRHGRQQDQGNCERRCPVFTASYTGFVGSDTLASAVTGSPCLATTATASSPVGSYPITAGLGSLAARNYCFSFVNGSLLVAAPPSVLTSAPITSSPTNAASAAYAVTFSEPVCNVSAADFQLTGTGTAGGAVTGVSAASGTCFTVSVGSLSGDGALRLDLKSGTTIHDANGLQPAAFTAGSILTVEHTPPASKVTSAALNACNKTILVTAGPVAAASTVQASFPTTSTRRPAAGLLARWPGNTGSFSYSVPLHGDYQSYYFYSIAHDAAGIVEKKTPASEALVNVPDWTPPVTKAVSATPNYLRPVPSRRSPSPGPALTTWP